MTEGIGRWRQFEMWRCFWIVVLLLAQVSSFTSAGNEKNFLSSLSIKLGSQGASLKKVSENNTIKIRLLEMKVRVRTHMKYTQLCQSKRFVFCLPLIAKLMKMNFLILNPCVRSIQPSVSPFVVLSDQGRVSGDIPENYTVLLYVDEWYSIAQDSPKAAEQAGEEEDEEKELAMEKDRSKGLKIIVSSILDDPVALSELAGFFLKSEYPPEIGALETLKSSNYCHLLPAMTPSGELLLVDDLDRCENYQDNLKYALTCKEESAWPERNMSEQYYFDQSKIYLDPNDRCFSFCSICHFNCTQPVQICEFPHFICHSCKSEMPALATTCPFGWSEPLYQRPMLDIAREEDISHMQSQCALCGLKKELAEIYLHHQRVHQVFPGRFYKSGQPAPKKGGVAPIKIANKKFWEAFEQAVVTEAGCFHVVLSDDELEAANIFRQAENVYSVYVQPGRSLPYAKAVARIWKTFGNRVGVGKLLKLYEHGEAFKHFSPNDKAPGRGEMYALLMVQEAKASLQEIRENWQDFTLLKRYDFLVRLGEMLEVLEGLMHELQFDVSLNPGAMGYSLAGINPDQNDYMPKLFPWVVRPGSGLSESRVALCDEYIRFAVETLTSISLNPDVHRGQLDVMRQTLITSQLADKTMESFLQQAAACSGRSVFKVRMWLQACRRQAESALTPFREVFPCEYQECLMEAKRVTVKSFCERFGDSWGCFKCRRIQFLKCDKPYQRLTSGEQVSVCNGCSKKYCHTCCSVLRGIRCNYCQSNNLCSMHSERETHIGCSEHRFSQPVNSWVECLGCNVMWCNSCKTLPSIDCIDCHSDCSERAAVEFCDGYPVWKCSSCEVFFGDFHAESQLVSFADQENGAMESIIACSQGHVVCLCCEKNDKAGKIRSHHPKYDALDFVPELESRSCSE